MRATKVITPIYIALLFAAMSCDKENELPASGQNDVVLFTANVAGATDGANSGNTPSTKGQLLNTGSADISLPENLSSFQVAAYDGTTRFIPASNASDNYVTVTYNNNKWSTENTYYWPGSSSKTFYAYANMPDNLNAQGGPSISCTSTGQVLTNFSINTDYTAQKDILMGYYSGNGSGGSIAARTAAIRFTHPLTAVRFKMGTPTDITINSLTSIKIEGIYSSGTVTQTDDTFAWSGFGTTTSVTMSNSGSALTEDGTSHLIRNTATNGDDTFILIPQNLASKNVTVKITAQTEEFGEKVFEGTLSTGEWEPGNVYTYEIQLVYNKFKLQLLNVANWTADSSEGMITRGAPLISGFPTLLAKTIHTISTGSETGYALSDIKSISFETGIKLEDWAKIESYCCDDNVVPGWASDALQQQGEEIIVTPVFIEEDYFTYKESEPIIAICEGNGNCRICTTADSIYLPINCAKLFYNCTNLESITGMTGGSTFPGCTPGIPAAGLSNVSAAHTTNMSYMFSNCTRLTTLNLSGLNASKVNNMAYMFYKCSNLQTLDLSNIITNSLQQAQGMFWDCTSLETLNISGLNTSKVTFMQQMFCNCTNLSTITGISGLKGDAVTTTKQMFYGCENLAKTEGSSPGTLDLSSFSTTNVTDMEGMFYNCKNISSITGINSWSGAAVTTTKQMFRGCNGLSTLDLSNFDTSIKLTTVEEMFRDCTNPGLVEINLNLLNTNGVTTFNGLFHSCYYVKKLTLGAEFKINSEATLTNMFKYLSYHNTGTACNIYCLPATQTTITSNATAVCLPLQSTLNWNELSTH